MVTFNSSMNKVAEEKDDSILLILLLFERHLLGQPFSLVLELHY